MESLLLGLEKELRTAAQTAVQGVVARTRQELQRMLQAALRERDAGVQEVARLRAELAQEVAAMQKVQAAHHSRARYRRRPPRHLSGHAAQPSLDAMFSVSVATVCGIAVIGS